MRQSRTSGSVGGPGERSPGPTRQRPCPLAPRLLSAALGLLLLAAPALATWSIVVVDTKTGEVCVAAATCLPNAPLKNWVPVVITGYGVAAAQSVVDIDATNRKVIWDGFLSGLTPGEILQQLAQLDPQHQGRQYGIVDLFNAPETFTGSGAKKAKAGVAAVAGDLRYAIQGNVLTGDVVVLAAEEALLNTPGDLSQRAMAAMEAARAKGGDGRCSCQISNPTGCGAPPPYFRKSAHTAFIVLARIGDADGTCAAQIGCANGAYYLELEFVGGLKAPDPVISLGRLYALWRESMVGVPDQVKSVVAPSVASLPPDGVSSVELQISLLDLDAGPVDPTGLVLSLEHLSGGTPLTQPGPILDLGGGSFTCVLTAGTIPGVDTWRVWVEDGAGPAVALQPDVIVSLSLPGAG